MRNVALPLEQQLEADGLVAGSIMPVASRILDMQRAELSAGGVTSEAADEMVRTILSTPEGRAKAIEALKKLAPADFVDERHPQARGRYGLLRAATYERDCRARDARQNAKIVKYVERAKARRGTQQ